MRNLWCVSGEGQRFLSAAEQVADAQDIALSRIVPAKVGHSVVWRRSACAGANSSSAARYSGLFFFALCSAPCKVSISGALLGAMVSVPSVSVYREHLIRRGLGGHTKRQTQRQNQQFGAGLRHAVANSRIRSSHFALMRTSDFYGWRRGRDPNRCGGLPYWVSVIIRVRSHLLASAASKGLYPEV